MFEHDRSAARGEMATRGLYVFKHDSQLGNAPAHSLFSKVTAEVNKDVIVPRAFEHYSVLFDGKPLAIGEQVKPQNGVTVTRMA
jgi:CRISPR-associated protein Csd2